MINKTFMYNGLSFVRTARELTDQVHGYYKELKSGIQLMDRERQPVALVCTNGGSVFTVTAFKFENTTRYMNSTTEKTEKFLNIKGLSYGKEIELSEQAIADFRA